MPKIPNRDSYSTDEIRYYVYYVDNNNLFYDCTLDDVEKASDRVKKLRKEYHDAYYSNFPRRGTIN